MPPFTALPPSNHMRALFYASHNQPRYHVLLGTLPIPKPQPGEALIKVHATAVTPTDVAGLSNRRPLFVPGVAFSGVLLTPTPHLPAGTRVAGVCASGAWAELVCVPHGALWQTDASFAEAAALAGVLSASLHAVQAAQIKAGDVVVVSGGVTAAGCVIAQIGVLYGARVVLGVRGASQVAVGEMLGVEAVVDRERERVYQRLEGVDVDVGVDTIGEASKLVKIVKRGGKVVRVMPVGEDGVEEKCRKLGVELVDVQARVDEKAVEVVKEVFESVRVRVPSGPVYGIAKWMLALEAAEKRVGAGCVVIMF